MSDQKIDQLLEWIESRASAVKIVTDTSIPIIKEILYKNKPLIDGCPSRASAAEFQLSAIKARVSEITELLNSLETELFAKYSDKK